MGDKYAVCWFIVVRVLLWLLVSIVPLFIVFRDNLSFSLTSLNYARRVGEMVFAVVPGSLVALASAAEIFLTSERKKRGLLGALSAANLIVFAFGLFGLVFVGDRLTSTAQVDGWLSASAFLAVVSLLSEGVFAHRLATDHFRNKMEHTS
jgi:hypothetical protein